jgi:tripartite ATP-independent transporter DctM subunit
MSPETAGIAGIALLLLLFLLRMPVAFSMALVGLIGFAYLGGIESALTLLAQDIFEVFTSYPLSVIPMFILMGSFAYASGISHRLYKSSYTWVGQLRGGLTVATVLACSGFAAICGSTAATAATMGRIALPEMKKYGYDDVLATGTVASAGTLGILIPPSTVLIVYGILTEESIGKLFVAGILPGFILSLFFVATVVLLCLRDPAAGPPGPQTTWKQKLKATTGILGWFSPTQAGAIGAFGALIIGIIRGSLKLKITIEAAKDGLRTACMVLFIIAGATVFGHFMAVSNIPFMLADWVGSLPFPPMVVMGVMIFIYFIFRSF